MVDSDSLGEDYEISVAAAVVRKCMDRAREMADEVLGNPTTSDIVCLTNMIHDRVLMAACHGHSESNDDEE